jgi:hypothetical protein
MFLLSLYFCFPILTGGRCTPWVIRSCQVFTRTHYIHRYKFFPYATFLLFACSVTLNLFIVFHLMVYGQCLHHRYIIVGVTTNFWADELYMLQKLTQTATTLNSIPQHLQSTCSIWCLFDGISTHKHCALHTLQTKYCILHYSSWIQGIFFFLNCYYSISFFLTNLLV